MRMTKLIGFLRWLLGRRFHMVVCSVVAFSMTMLVLLAQPDDPELKVMKMGLGEGTISSNDGRINCGIDCDDNYTGSPGPMVTLRATVPDPTTSRFAGWSGDCASFGTAPCDLTMDTPHQARAEFRPIPDIIQLTDSQITPEGIRTYLAAHTEVNTPGRFIKALPDDFKQNWILMSRSESLQTGTARSPRILLPSATAQNVFTVGAITHPSYPGADPHAIEYMQWDPAQKNFRFHEIKLADIGAMGDTLPDGSRRFSARTRGVSIDDEKCPKCHSTRNVLNLDRDLGPTATPTPGRYNGTDGIPPGSVGSKNKPNWDAYDSWAGMLPFNRDRIYQGSVEAAAFRHIFNFWNWRGSAENDTVREVIEQLKLQPDTYLGTPHSVTRDISRTDDLGHIQFGFDSLSALAAPTNSIAYSFERPSETPTTVNQGGRYVTLRHSNPRPIPSNDLYDNPVSDEGRGVQFFDLLAGADNLLDLDGDGNPDGSFNAQRIADEVINHHYATGSVLIDVRPMVMAISLGTCLRINTTTNTVERADPSFSALTIDQEFFRSRNGMMNISQVQADTETRWTAATGSTPEVAATRSTNYPRRKVDFQARNFDRTNDPYLYTGEAGLMQLYGGVSGPASVTALRQELFRRPRVLDVGQNDVSVMRGKYTDREAYGYNTDRVSMYRYFLEPLGVSVDKWSMGVRGRSRTYTFADVFSSYDNVIQPKLRQDLLAHRVTGLTDPYDCSQLIDAINLTLGPGRLPGREDVPKYTDVQRIFNKSCIECHGGLGYPPYGTGSLDFSENEHPPATVPTGASPRLYSAHRKASTYASLIYAKIREETENCRPPLDIGMMPCGGPALSKVDVETIRRWIAGTTPNSEGDPHLTTVNGVPYDFQSAGEFVLLRDEDLEIQTRQTPVDTAGPLGPNDHTGLSSCVSINTAVAVRVGSSRVTYEPNLSGRPDPNGLQLRVDGKLADVGAHGLLLESGGRIIRTSVPGGIQVETPGGTVVEITPQLWSDYQVWFLNINTRRVRATEGVMGSIATGDWLPTLPDGRSLGPLPLRDLHRPYVDLYVTFENAWRVTDASTLFDYAPGTSTASFTFEGWPEENPERCIAPRSPSGPVTGVAPKTLPMEVAQQHCSGIVAGNRRMNCVTDVMATGEPGFAKAYLLTEQIERNALPSAPVLVFPEDKKADISTDVTFTWDAATDSNDDPVRYRHCVWLAGEDVSFKDCDASPVAVTTSRSAHLLWLLLIILIGCLLLVVLFFLGMRTRPLLASFAGLIIIVTVTLALHFGRTSASQLRVRKTISAPQLGKAYLWRVMAEDGKGGSTESETRRFTVK